MSLLRKINSSKYQPQLFIIIRKHFAYTILFPASVSCAKGIEMQIRWSQSSSRSSHQTLKASLCLLWNQNVHYRVHNSLTVICIRSHNQNYILNFHLFNMHFNIILPSTPRFIYELLWLKYFMYFATILCDPIRSANTILFSLITSVQYKILIEIVKGRKHLVALVVDNRIILNLV